MDHEDAIFEALCEVECHRDSVDVIKLDHHLYNNLSDRWMQQGSKPQPFVKLVAAVHLVDYAALGLKLKNPKNAVPTKLPAMADTKCQSCLASLKVIERLGLCKSDLIPVSMKMHAANNNGINILGAAIIRFTGETGNGGRLETRQITYVTNDSNKLFLSREACADLGMISKNFPTIGEALPVDRCLETSDEPTASESTMTPNCDCPRRQPPPSKPLAASFPLNEENRQNLEDWLIGHYQSSTFNTCEHQPLPKMEGPPLRLMIKPDATPVVQNKPIPVPLHWKDDVKSGLDQDVRLGVIEPVPVGEPDTWVHRMIITAKKNGNPRRTVDLQSLNVHATR